MALRAIIEAIMIGTLRLDVALVCDSAARVHLWLLLKEFCRCAEEA